MGRQIMGPISTLLFLIIKGYMLLLVGGYCLIYSLLSNIAKSNKGTLEKE